MRKLLRAPVRTVVRTLVSSGPGLRLAIEAEGIPETDGSVRKSGNRRFHKGVKGPRLEFNAEGPTFVLEETRELSRHHAVDFGLVFLNDQMNARVRERLLDVRFLPCEIPTDDPIVFYEETQVLCGQISRELKLRFARFEIQNASGFSDG